MEQRKLNAEALSGRQLAVAALVAGLSPAAVWAGRAMWFWVLLWSGAAVILAALVLWRMRSAPAGEFALPIRILYAGWAVVLSSRVLSGIAERLEQTSGGSPGFWLLVIVVVPLAIIGWGKAAPLFRMTEILWLALAVTLVLVCVPAVGTIEWRGLLVRSTDWKTAALTVGEIMVPAVFVLPYIYSVESGSGGKGIRWLSALGGIAGVMCLLTAGMLGAGSVQVPRAFFAAAGLTGGNARSEGLLSVIWLLPDLVYVSLLCRTWGRRWWPGVAAVLSAAVSMTGIQKYFETEICVVGTLLLLFLTVLFCGKREKFVVQKKR